MEKFELGPLQKMWLEQLRKHPERQTAGFLGAGTPEKYEACCLGELHLCAHRLAGKELPFNKKRIHDHYVEGLLDVSFKKYGLHAPSGVALNEFITSRGTFYSLANANDGNVSWLEIADIVEKNPENFFNKSV